MHTNPIFASRKKALQRKLNELLQPSAERESIKVESFADPLDHVAPESTRPSFLPVHFPEDPNSPQACEAVIASKCVLRKRRPCRYPHRTFLHVLLIDLHKNKIFPHRAAGSERGSKKEHC
jgi:hypothetical protein